MADGEVAVLQEVARSLYVLHEVFEKSTPCESDMLWRDWNMPPAIQAGLKQSLAP